MNAHMVLSIVPADTATRPIDGDRDLVIKARRGEDAAWQEIVQSYRPVAFRIALQILRRREDALDVAQETMVRFYSTFHRFKASRPIKPWIVRIAHNLAVDIIRRRRLRRNVSLDKADGERPIDPPVEEPDALDTIQRDEIAVILWREVNRLDDIYREIVILRDYNDLAYAEIASILQIPVGTVMSRLHKARKLLGAAVRRAMRPTREDTGEEDGTRFPGRGEGGRP